MSATISSTTHIDSIERFIKHLDHEEDYYFMFAGRIQPWEDETEPPTALASYNRFKEIRDSLIYMKKLETSNCIPGLKRYNWQSGTMYSPWQFDKDMLLEMKFTHPLNPYYVFVDDYSTGILSRSVFMCLDNNNGAASTVQPFGTISSPFETADGYIWKFMYNVRNDYYQYINDAVIPCPFDDAQKSVEQLGVEQNTTPGTINSIRIDNPGSGYIDGTILIEGDGDGATASFVVDIETGAIADITITNPGQGYSYANLTISSGTEGINAEVTAMISPREGHGYSAAEQLNASHAIIRGSFIATEDNIFPAQNTYRRIGILKNPKSINDSLLISDKYNFFDELQVSNISATFPLAQEIKGVVSGTTARIFYRNPITGPTASFYIVDREGDFMIGEDIVYIDSEGTTIATASIDDINLTTQDKYSGDLIYYENVQFLSRRSGQTERFVFSIEF